MSGAATDPATPYVIVVRDHFGTRIYGGPYSSAPAASGAALQEFGPRGCTGSADWTVRPLERLGSRKGTRRG